MQSTELKRISSFLVICGNDGCGKTSTARIINEMFSRGQTNCYAFQRSTKPQVDSPFYNVRNTISPKHIDQITFLYTFEKRPELCHEVQFDGRQIAVKWIMLDVQIKEIERRIRNRIEMTIYEAKKCIQYYQRVYRELAAFYGLPLVPTDGKKVQEVAKEVMAVVDSNRYGLIHRLAWRNFTQDLVRQHDLHQLLLKQAQKYVEKEQLPQSLYVQLQSNGLFRQQTVEIVKKDNKLAALLLSKWLIDKPTISHPAPNTFQITREAVSLRVETDWALRLVVEGESKKLYRIMLPNNDNYFDNQVVIILKSTIYSHTKQHTGIIENLAKVRAVGSQIFIDFMMRNELKHCYRCVSSQGIILSDWAQITPLEMVFKKYWAGTDKHSYHNMGDKQYDIVTGNDKELQPYHRGIYLRFDWRNPNHVTSTKQSASDNPFYYILEDYVGKQQFFDRYLRNSERCHPLGDKCVYPDLAAAVCELPKIRLNMLRIYCTFQYYLKQVGLELIDGCFMMDRQGQRFWSEINPDCMRIRATNLEVKYDKDIWRAGGSSSKEEIMKKWVTLNELLMEYLCKNRFHQSELLVWNQYPYQIQAQKMLKKQSLDAEYRNMYRVLAEGQKKKKSLIATIDLHDGKPSLVKSSKVFEHHSEESALKAFQSVRIFDQLLMVDLNGALKDSKESSKKNRDIIKECAAKRKLMTGGGLHTAEDVKEVLEAGVSKIVIGSNTNPDFLAAIDKNRLIIELSINDKMEVLIDGRKTNTGVKAADKIRELVQLGIKHISITLVMGQGHLLGLDQPFVRNLLVEIPRCIQTIIIAGGITTLEDLKFLWTFGRVVPQLGSAIWKGKLTASDIIPEMVNYDDKQLVPVIITTGKEVKGLIYLNKEALRMTCQTKKLHRFSRQHNRVMMKGQTSNDIQEVESIQLDCDGDSLLITVDSKHNFCHLPSFSCFS